LTHAGQAGTASACDRGRHGPQECIDELLARARDHDRGAQLTRALRSVDAALEKLEERGEVMGLHRLREDLGAALQHAAVAV
jgi:hypothetical protein